MKASNEFEKNLYIIISLGLFFLEREMIVDSALFIVSFLLSQ